MDYTHAHASRFCLCPCAPLCRSIRASAIHHCRGPARTTRHSRRRRSQHPSDAQARQLQGRLSASPRDRRPRVSGAGAEHSRAARGPRRVRVGALNVDVRPSPLTVVITNSAGQPVQEIVFEEDGACRSSSTISRCSAWARADRGRSRARTGASSRCSSIGAAPLDTMEPRWQSDMYGSRNPVAMLFGTSGWGLFVATPWVQVDLRDARSRQVPAVQADRQRARPADRAQPAAGARQGIPPVDQIVPGLYDVFVFDAHDPADGAAGLRVDHRAAPRCRRNGRWATCSRIARSKTKRRCSASSTRSARSGSRSTR